MTIKQQGGVFGRNPTFNSVNANLLSVDGNTLHVDATNDRVGINTSSPVVPLESNTSGNGLPAASGTAQPNGAFRISSPATSGIIDIGPNGGAPWIQATDRTDLSQVYTLSLNPNGGNVSIGNGNLVIGTSGKGIDFSATSGTGTSELFDDYEEGTWTPVLSDGTNNATMGSAAGSYTKIGRQVFCKCRVVTTALGSVSGGIRVTGLPFTVAAGSGLENIAGGVASFGSGLAITAGSSISISPQQNTTRALLYVWDDVAGTTAMQATEWTDDGNAYFEFSYLA